MTFPNRSNENFPDIEQEKRAQARQASEFARGERNELPTFVTKGPDRVAKEEAEASSTPEPESTPEPAPAAEPEPTPESEPQQVTPEAPEQNA